MADNDWLRNLARARLEKGGWVVEDQDEVKRLALARIEETTHALYEEAREAVEIFNAYSRGRKAIRILPIKPRAGAAAGGFMLLLGTTQIDLEYVATGGIRLEATLKTLKGFQRRGRRLLVLKPHVDPFGSDLWQADKNLLMSNELIMKTLLEQLARAAFEAGDFDEIKERPYLEGARHDMLEREGR